MRFSRKTILIILSALITVSAAGCGNTQKNGGSVSNSEETVSSSSEISTESKEELSSASESIPDESSAPEESSDPEDGPVPEVSDPTPDSEGEMVNGIFVYNGTAYELFYGYDSLAEYYAESVSAVKAGLGDDYNIYNVLVPTHVAVDLPDKFNDLCADQTEYFNDLTSAYTEDIIPVNTMNKLLHHRNEYLYFNSDHHWTALAAYYAYQEFAKTAGIDAVDLSELHEGKIDGYSGSLAAIGDLDGLKDDYVVYYTSDDDIECTRYDENGEDPWDYSLIHTYAEGANAYGVFLGGDSPLLVAKNNDGNGKKIAVLKESYGNAFCPFIAYTYSETHMIDFRYINFDLKQYLEDNDIHDIIIINNAMASATGARCDELRALVG